MTHFVYKHNIKVPVQLNAFLYYVNSYSADDSHKEL